MYLKCLALSLLYNKHTLKIRHYCGFSGVSSFGLQFLKHIVQMALPSVYLPGDLSLLVLIPILHATLGSVDYSHILLAWMYYHCYAQESKS